MDVVTITMNPALDREIIIPNFQVNELHRVFEREKFISDPGGKGINVSMMLSSLNETPSIAMGFLGGHTGRIISEELRKRFPKITLNFIHIDGESRENISILDEENHFITEINAPGPVIQEPDLNHFLKLFNTVVSRTKITVISGSVPQGIPLDTYAFLSKNAMASGNKVYVEARGQLLTETIKKACPNIVRPDMRSTNKILGKVVESLEEYLDAGKEIIRYGADMVVISYKSKNDIILTKDAAWLLTIAQDELDESHLLGTGDAFIAAMIYDYLNSNSNFLDRAKFGMAAALAKTNYLKKEMPPLYDIQKELEHIKVERIN
ncbi:MAG TPA: 1-phosphofructokinase family hexose kinase [Thermotogota bacterium]|nr:1-phosphofructokinase family hexose kinase [Thermotogota bacterium]HPJ88544.1 1-phosphofructokinase family hexose kinase [Thermotogota bacterium]HPR96478.1 1-phosphofructokinase family hexose kinase [Thermotogota bacterium]